MINTSLRLSVRAFSVPRAARGARLDLAQAPAGSASAPVPPAPPAARKSVGAIAARTLMGAAEGALAGYIGGPLGGVVGGFAGLAQGGGLGWHAGAALSLRLASKTGQGKVNPIVGGIGSLTLPVATTLVGATAGTIAFAMAGAQGNIVLGAAMGGTCALLAELCR